MFRYLVVSDSHNPPTYLARVARRCAEERCDGIIHLGDTVEDARALQRLTGMRVEMVAGNAPGDMLSREPRMKIVQAEGVRLLLCHGHDYGVKYTYDRLSYAASEQEAQVALFGHTHRAFSGYVGSVLLVNPGPLKQGRYAVLELENGVARPFLKSLAEDR